MIQKLLAQGSKVKIEEKFGNGEEVDVALQARAAKQTSPSFSPPTSGEHRGSILAPGTSRCQSAQVPSIQTG